MAKQLPSVFCVSVVVVSCCSCTCIVFQELLLLLLLIVITSPPGVALATILTCAAGISPLDVFIIYSITRKCHLSHF